MILEIQEVHGYCPSVIRIKTDEGSMSHTCSRAPKHDGLHSAMYHLNGVFLRVEWRKGIAE